MSSSRHNWCRQAHTRPRCDGGRTVEGERPRGFVLVVGEFPDSAQQIPQDPPGLAKSFHEPRSAMSRASEAAVSSRARRPVRRFQMLWITLTACTRSMAAASSSAIAASWALLTARRLRRWSLRLLAPKVSVTAPRVTAPVTSAVLRSVPRLACRKTARGHRGVSDPEPGCARRAHRARSWAPWHAQARLAERRHAPSLGPPPSLLDPLRNQRLVGACHAAQPGHGLPPGLVLGPLRSVMPSASPATSASRSQRPPAISRSSPAAAALWSSVLAPHRACRVATASSRTASIRSAAGPA